MVSSNPNLATGSTRAAYYHSGVLNTSVLDIAGPEPLQESLARDAACSALCTGVPAAQGQLRRLVLL